MYCTVQYSILTVHLQYPVQQSRTFIVALLLSLFTPTVPGTLSLLHYHQQGLPFRYLGDRQNFSFDVAIEQGLQALFDVAYFGLLSHGTVWPKLISTANRFFTIEQGVVKVKYLGDR